MLEEVGSGVLLGDANEHHCSDGHSMQAVRTLRDVPESARPVPRMITDGLRVLAAARVCLVRARINAPGMAEEVHDW